MVLNISSSKTQLMKGRKQVCKNLDKRQISFCPSDMSELEIEEVIAVFRSGWITTGPKTKEFKRCIAAYGGVNKAVCLNSHMACAEMQLRVLGVGVGDEGVAV